MTLTRVLIPILFTPAGMGLLLQAFSSASTADTLLAIALALFCPELARMAIVDLENVAAIANRLAENCSQTEISALQQDSRLLRFYRVVISTIVLETTGFYIALWSLVFGAAIVIVSQLWFNLLAGIQLWPQAAQPITSFGIVDRSLVLIANVLGLGMLLVWPIEMLRLYAAVGLLLLILLFLAIKYTLPAAQPQPPSENSSHSNLN